MNLPDNLGDWLISQIETTPLDLLRAISPRAENWLNQIFGRQEAEEMRILLAREPEPDDGVCTVLLPGVMGSLLASVRGISTLLWFNPSLVLSGKINLLDLNEDGSADRAPDIQVVPIGIEKTNYLRGILTLADKTRLYEFPYDWRKRLEYNARLLHESLERWSSDKPGRRFSLVGHSMGGVVARAYLAAYPEAAERRVDKCILLASPFHGTPMAAQTLTGQNPSAQMVRQLHPSNHVERFARNAPSLYQVLPPPEDLWQAPAPYPFNWECYHAPAWRLAGMRQDYLDQARRFCTALCQSDPQVEIWQIAGYGQPTTVAIRQSQNDRDPDSPLFINVLSKDEQEDGDGSIPLWSIRGRNVRELYVRASHADIPNNAAVLEDVIRIARGERPLLPSEIPSGQDILDQVQADTEDWSQQLEILRTRLREGSLTRDDVRHLFFSQ